MVSILVKISPIYQNFQNLSRLSYPTSHVTFPDPTYLEGHSNKIFDLQFCQDSNLSGPLTNGYNSFDFGKKFAEIIQFFVQIFPGMIPWRQFLRGITLRRVTHDPGESVFSNLKIE